MTEDEQNNAFERAREKYREEGWGRIAEMYGLDPLNVESQARRAYQVAYDTITQITQLMNRPIDRDKVYTAVDSERDYQDARWGDTLSGGRPAPKGKEGFRTLDEWVLYINHYAGELQRVAGTSNDPTEILNFVRKVAALGVVCMEQHGAPHREGFEK